VSSYQDIDSRLGVVERKLDFIMAQFKVTKTERSFLDDSVVRQSVMSLTDLYRELTTGELLPMSVSNDPKPELDPLSNQPAPQAGSEAAQPNVPMEDAAKTLAELTKDFERLKNQKSRPTGGVEGTTLVNLCMLNDEQYVNYRQKALSLEPQDANKLYLSFNLIAPRFNKVLGRLSAFNAPFKARPNRKDPQAIEDAEIVDRMIVALDEKLDEPSRMRERLWWAGLGGVSFEYVPWIPNASIEPMPQFDGAELLFKNLSLPEGDPGQIIPASQMEQMVQAGATQESFEIYEDVQMVGEVGSEILGPLNVFIDQSVRSVQDLSPDQWVHIAKIRTCGWVEENFGEEVKPMKDLSLISSKINGEGEASGGTFLKDLIPWSKGPAMTTTPRWCSWWSRISPRRASAPMAGSCAGFPNSRSCTTMTTPTRKSPSWTSIGRPSPPRSGPNPTSPPSSHLSGSSTSA
jgi:hypothetical protein